MLHVYRGGRPGQVRGVSWFAPVVLRLKDFDDYEDAALLKQKIAACLAVLTTDVDGTAPPLGTVDPAAPAVDMLEPGQILNLRPVDKSPSWIRRRSASTRNTRRPSCAPSRRAWA